MNRLHELRYGARVGLGDPSPTFAFCARGDARDAAAFSGAPSSVIRALADLGAAPTVINTELPPNFQRFVVNVSALSLMTARDAFTGMRHPSQLRFVVRAHKPELSASREMFALLSMVATARLTRFPGVTHAIQFGSEYRVPPHVTYVTFDDATIIQLHRSYDYEWMKAVPHGTLVGMMGRQRTIFHKAKACCFLNHWAAESAINDYGVPPARVHVVGAGSNRDIAPKTRDWSRPRFLFVAMDFDRKNGYRLLDAFSRVFRDNPEVRLDVVGRHPPLFQDGVVGHGVLRLDDHREKAHLDALFAQATCLVLPSLLEPTGYVHAEALAAGIGSIGTENGGVATLIGDAGIRVSPDSVDSIAWALSQFCDPALAREYGERAGERAALFTWTAVAERLLRALRPPGIDQTSLAAFL